jgi:alpha-glucosidase
MDKALWWQTGVVYQIYPRSFMDSNGDGVGDLQGVIDRLPYLESLGIDALWLSPIYPSPMADFGYDVSNYTDIHPLFGSIDDFDRLLEKAHRRGLKVMLDLVPNHTSNEHPWFLESRASRDNPKRDWFIWLDPGPDGGPPNNWLSHFGGPAWTLDEATGQYYLHSFLREQPDLNYRNPDVLEAMLDAMRFWLDKGVDGFRVDVIWLMAKDADFRDEPPNPDYRPGQRSYASLLHVHTQDIPEVHDIIRAMRQVLDQYDERMMVGEIYLPYDRLMTYYGPDLDEVHLPFNFQLILSQWSGSIVRALVEEYERGLPPGGWPNWVLGNHDKSRIATRIGRAQARVATMLLLTLRGTPTCYYGDEIGMVDVDVPPHKMQDPAGLNEPDVPGASRDPQRTPMQWDGGPNAGFCPPDVEPWLPLAPDYREYNVVAADHDPHSMLTLFRRLTALRRMTPAFTLGSYRGIDVGQGDVFAYERAQDGDRYLVLLNFSDAACPVRVADLGERAVIVVSTHLDHQGMVDSTCLTLRPNEGLVLQLE